MKFTFEIRFVYKNSLALMGHHRKPMGGAGGFKLRAWSCDILRNSADQA